MFILAILHWCFYFFSLRSPLPYIMQMLHVVNKLFVKFGRPDWRKGNLITIFSLKNVSKCYFLFRQNKAKKILTLFPYNVMFLICNYKEVACKEVMFCVIPPGSFVFIFKSVTADQNIIIFRLKLIKQGWFSIFFIS